MRTDQQIINKMKVISKRLDSNFARPYSDEEAHSIEWWHHKYSAELKVLSWLTGFNKNKFTKSKSVN